MVHESGFGHSVDEVSLRKTATLVAVFVLSLVLCVSGCRGKATPNTATAPITQTIAPADGKPAVDGSDAVTQTVDVEDGRSDDGGVLTNPQPAKKAGAVKPPVKRKK